MSLRRAGSLLLVLALAACKSVTQEPQPADLVFATFSSPTIPTPNDLALAQVPGGVPCTAMPDGQAQLLCTFVKAGGFPSDQEVPISIPISAVHWSAAATAEFPYGHYVAAAPPTIDLGTVTDTTVTILRVDVTPPAPVAFNAVATPGLLTLRKKSGANGRRWDAGARYVVAVRGGASGVKTTTGLPLNADSAVALVIPDKDLTNPANQPLGAIPDANHDGTNADEIASLEALRAATWRPLTWSNATGGWAPAPSAAVTPAFQAVDAAFPHAETATIATFGTAPSAGPVVLIDAGSGVAPLPIDLLRTSAGGTIDFNPAFGPAAAGLATLDGFSTTAMIIAQTSVPVDAGTVNGGNVFLYRLPAGGTPVLVKELKQELGLGAGGDPGGAGYIAEPPAIVIAAGAGGCPASTGGCSPAIGLQPAARVPLGPGFDLPPLEENALYGVVITSRVKDVLGRPLVRPTVAKLILEFTHLLKTDGLTSDVPGVGDATARALAAMQAALAPIWGPGILPAGTTRNDVVTAYTFKTQGIADVALSLSAAPYSVELGARTAIFTPDAAPVAVTPPAGTNTNVAGFYDVQFKSVDAIDKTTGALRPTLAADLASANVMPTLLVELHALVAVPDPALVPFCAGGSGPRCARLVVFGHGLNGSRETLFATASSLASRGFVAAAIDFPLHGGRNWCAASADCVMPDGTTTGTCTPFTGGAGQGDAVPPGVCTGGSAPRVFSAPGVNVPSRYFLGANFFRMRDAFRQNLLDQSALVLALARPPAAFAPPPGYPQPGVNPFAALLTATGGMVIDPTSVLYEGISLGSIAGTSVVATNPRFSRAAFSVGGGTFVDIGITSPTFRAELAPLFTGLLQAAGALPAGTAFSFDMVDPTKPAFNPGVAAGFLQIVTLAKWIVDPGDPINYARHLRAEPLPNLLADPGGGVPQPAKDVFSQIALADSVVPNSTSYLLDGLSQSYVTLYDGPSATHAMLALVARVQADAALYLDNLTVPGAAVTLP